jgi:hypothetical protein
MKNNWFTKCVAVIASFVTFLTGCVTFTSGDREPPTAEQIAAAFTPIAAYGVSKLVAKNPELAPFLPLISGVVREFHDSGEVSPAILATKIREALKANGIEVLKGEDAAVVTLVVESVISFYKLYAGDPSIKVENRPQWLRAILLIIADGIDAQNLTV